MTGPTNADDLVLTCPACGATAPCPTTLAHAWPVHCNTDMVLRNLTDRDGLAVTIEHPYESELP